MRTCGPKRRKFSEALYRRVFDKSKGTCYLCHCKLKFKIPRQITRLSKSRWLVGFRMRHEIKVIVRRRPKREMRDWVIEHKTPLSKGGNHDFKNLWPACDYCNRSKHNRTLAEFRAGKNAFEDDDILHGTESFVPHFECT